VKRLTPIILCFAVLTAAARADSAAPAAIASATSATPGMVYVAVLRNGFTLSFDHRRIMQDTSRLYLTAGEDSFVDVANDDIVSLSQEEQLSPPGVRATRASSAVDLKSVVAAASDKNLLDADLIESVIRAESGFNARAVSPKGARGLMQLMPETAAKLGVQDAFDPLSNVEGGTRYLRDLLRLYNDDLAKALAAYNAGPQRVDQYHGVPPYRETRAYVSNVIRDYNRKKLAARKAQPDKQQGKKKAPAAKGDSAAAKTDAALGRAPGPHPTTNDVLH
jgi:soluble lytic murein transglycosylase-like protein